MDLFKGVGQALRMLDPEMAHDASLTALAAAPRRLLTQQTQAFPRLRQSLFGLSFANPVGLAAGYDKNALVPDAMFALGMGFAEIGTVTPVAQAGNPKPRVFRLPDHGAVINRLGFNNEGHGRALERLKRLRKADRLSGGVLGVNIGANKDSEDRMADYAAGIAAFAGVADYFTVNISSPNTPGLRDLQAPDALRDLMDRVLEARAACATPSVPVLVKLSPDNAEEDLPAMVDVLGSRADGIIVTNTTLARDMLDADKADQRYHQEAGGLSGEPLFARSTRVLAMVHELTGGALPLIGVGGIASGEDAVAKIKAGAHLVQLYTGLIYRGPGLIGDICAAVDGEMSRACVTSIDQLVGTGRDRWLEKPAR